MGFTSNIKINEAETYNRNKYITPGEYVVKVDSCVQKKMRSGGSAYIVECDVLESSNLQEHPLGSKVSFFVDLNNDSAAQNLKKLGLALLGIDMSDVEKVKKVCAEPKDGGLSLLCQALEASTESQKLRGREFAVSAEIVTTKRGTPFTATNYRPVRKQAS